MISAPDVIEAFREAGVEMFTGVPDSLMKELSQAFSNEHEHIAAANEGVAIGIAAGHYLASGSPAVVYMQNSGLPNAMNPLTSLAANEVYGLPMVLLIGWRGQPGVGDEPQHALQGSVTRAQLELLGIDSFVLGPAGELKGTIDMAVKQSNDLNSPVAILVEKGTFSSSSEPKGEPGGLSRESVIEKIISIGQEAIFVATTGYTSRELAILRNERKEGGDRDFLMVGSMGHAAAIALGITNSSEAPVVCLDGDGALAMHLGVLPTIASSGTNRLIHVVLNNGIHESVGGQPTVLAQSDIAAIARSAGYATAERITDLDQLSVSLKAALASVGPHLLDVGIRPGARDSLPRPSEFAARREALMTTLMND